MVFIIWLGLLATVCLSDRVLPINGRDNCFMREDLSYFAKLQENEIVDLQNQTNSLVNKCDKEVNTNSRKTRADSDDCTKNILDLYKKTNTLRSLDRDYHALQLQIKKTEKQVVAFKNNVTEECSKTLDGFGSPRIVLRFNGGETSYNTWLSDSTVNDGRIWLTRGYGPIYQVFEYASESHLRANDTTIVYFLPFPCKGTGHVVMNGALYCNRWNNYNIVKYDFKAFKIVREVSHTLYYQAPYAAYYWHHRDSKVGGVDLAVDEMGLWAISASTTSSGADIVISKLDPDTLKIIGSWSTSLDRYQTMDAFMRCGTLYGVYYNHYINKRQCFYFRYDTKVSKQYSTCSNTPRFPPFRDQNLGTDMKFYYLNYNPVSKQLHASAYQTFLSYQVFTKYQ